MTALTWQAWEWLPWWAWALLVLWALVALVLWAAVVCGARDDEAMERYYEELRRR